VSDLIPASNSEGRCALCGREVGSRSRHHLKPRSEGGLETAALCSGCHRQIHALFTNTTLARELDTLEKLRAAPEMRSYLKWASRQQDRHLRVRRSRSRR
jgi:hypothetical protein